jgi:phosphate uptake regulator
MISRIIERIGDHAVRISENTQKMPGNSIEPELLATIRKASTLALSIFDKSIISFFNADMKGSHRNIEQVETLEALCEDINVLAMKRDPFVAVSLRYIAESIRRTGEYAGDISESVINYLVDERA